MNGTCRTLPLRRAGPLGFILVPSLQTRGPRKSSVNASAKGSLPSLTAGQTHSEVPDGPPWREADAHKHMVHLPNMWAASVPTSLSSSPLGDFPEPSAWVQVSAKPLEPPDTAIG